MIYADDLLILDEMFEGLMKKISIWKNCLDSEKLKVNMGKTKVMLSGRDLHTLQSSDKYLCEICRNDVGKNWILCSGCALCVHKKCSDISDRLVEDLDFRCRRCIGNARAVDGRARVGKSSPTCWWKVWCSWQFFLSWRLYLPRWTLWACHY